MKKIRILHVMAELLIGATVALPASAQNGQIAAIPSGAVGKMAQGTWGNRNYPDAGGPFSINLSENGARVDATIKWGASTCPGPWAAAGTKSAGLYSLQISSAGDCGRVTVYLRYDGSGSFQSSTYGEGYIRASFPR